MVTKDWRSGPQTIEKWPSYIDYVLAIDENGTPDLKYLRKCLRLNIIPNRNHTQFTVTGVSFSRHAYINLKNGFDRIKNKYWTNGMAEYKGRYKRVCLHYSEIHKKQTPFNLKRYDEFISEIKQEISNADCQIFSCSIDKMQHLIKHKENAYHPYNLSIGFILERFCHMLNQSESSGIIMIESRKKMDHNLLKHIIGILENGHYPNLPEHFRNIKGVYFNPKWRLSDNSQSTYSILEYADYVSKIIHDHVYYDSKETLENFNLIENKLYRPWGDYSGWGLKIYPEKVKTASVSPGG